VPRRICPIEQGDGTNVQSYSVSSTYIPVYSNGCAMYTELLGRFHWSPNIVSIVLTHDLSVFLELLINRQTTFTLHQMRFLEILTLLITQLLRKHERDQKTK